MCCVRQLLSKKATYKARQFVHRQNLDTILFPSLFSTYFVQVRLLMSSNEFEFSILNRNLILCFVLWLHRLPFYSQKLSLNLKARDGPKAKILFLLHLLQSHTIWDYDLI